MPQEKNSKIKKSKNRQKIANSQIAKKYSTDYEALHAFDWEITTIVEKTQKITLKILEILKPSSFFFARDEKLKKKSLKKKLKKYLLGAKI